jgi:murein DD-endopeptidase MepM/ murein hydrolase activator NlpD
MTTISQPVRSAFRRFDPTQLGLLGLLALPTLFSDSFESLELFWWFFLFWLWPLVNALFSGQVRFVVSNLPLMVNPFVQAQSFAQIAGHIGALARYRGHPPAPERYEQTTDLTLPFDGTWNVVNGGVTKADSHSWFPIAQRYAYDFCITDEEGHTHDGNGTDHEDYYCYSEAILAPADGVVVAASDGHRDSPYFEWLDPLQRDIRGNYVTIKHAEDEYSLLAHLQEGSIVVSEGERIERGQQIGRCGHSGNSTEPHLHFQLQDRPRFFAAGLPIAFDQMTIEADDERIEKQSINAGQEITPVATS